MKIFVKDFSRTMQARMLIFGMQVGDNLLYRRIKNQFTPAYFFLYLFSFPTYHTLKNEIFCQISPVIQAIMLIFSIHFDDDLYYGMETSLLLLILLCICPIKFLSFYSLRNKMFRQRYLHNHAS